MLDLTTSNREDKPISSSIQTTEQLITCFKKWHPLFFDKYSRACAWIAPRPRWPMTYGEYPKASKLNASTLLKDVGNIFENVFNQPLYVGAKEMRIAHSNQRDKLGLIHDPTMTFLQTRGMSQKAAFYKE